MVKTNKEQIFNDLKLKFPDIEFNIPNDYKDIATKNIISMICKTHKKQFFLPLKKILKTKKLGCDICHGRFFDIDFANNFHNYKYDYSKVNYIDASTPVEIICDIHGSFLQTPKIHYRSGCPKCGNIKKNTKISETSRNSDKLIIDKFNEANIDNKFLLKEINFPKITFICKKHNKEKSIQHNRLHLLKCEDCITDDIKIKTIENLKVKFKEIHNEKYQYDWESYISTHKNMRIFCNSHNEWFQQDPTNHLRGHGCPKCGNINSKEEENLFLFISENFSGTIERKNRTILDGKEIDIYIPDLNLGFEYNGLYFHSEEFREKDFHFNKSKTCLDKGIQLIHIYEDDWISKQDIIKNKILNLLKINTRIFARKCKIREIPNKKSKDFLNKNHIQGFIPAQICIGLFFNNELVSVMTFIESRFNTDCDVELLRYCSNHNIIGGASKLLNYFEKNFDFKRIVSYANFDYSNGNLYKKLGFEFKGFSDPSYHYFKKNSQIRLSRLNFQKHKLKEKLDIYDETLSETENMRNNNYLKIYNSGNMVFIKDSSKT